MSMGASDKKNKRKLDSSSNNRPRSDRPTSLGPVALFVFVCLSFLPVSSSRRVPNYYSAVNQQVVDYLNRVSQPVSVPLPVPIFSSFSGEPIFRSGVEKRSQLLGSTSADITRSLQKSFKSNPNYGDSELSFIEELSESCRTNPISCDVLSSLMESELDNMMNKAEDRLLKDVVNDMADVNDDLLLSRAVRSPEADLNRLVSQSRTVKQRLKNARRRGRYGLKFSKIG